jgi:Family of unknown function (DUF6084)
LSVPRIPLPQASSLPELAFAVESAEAVRYAAVPTIAFRLQIGSDTPVRSLTLSTQIRIAVTRRSYDPAAQERLVELFGEPSRWGQTLRSLLWTHATLVVPPFNGGTVVELPVACTYDFDIAAAKYFHALDDGEVPLELLFSGTVFYTSETGALQTAQIPWEHEAAFRLPVAVWKQAIEHHFPGTAWLRIRRDSFDRLYAYKARRSLPTWEAALDQLLEGQD